jgi:hypothetical protein
MVEYVRNTLGSAKPKYLFFSPPPAAACRGLRPPYPYAPPLRRGLRPPPYRPLAVAAAPVSSSSYTPPLSRFPPVRDMACAIAEAARALDRAATGWTGDAVAGLRGWAGDDGAEYIPARERRRP